MVRLGMALAELGVRTQVALLKARQLRLAIGAGSRLHVCPGAFSVPRGEAAGSVAQQAVDGQRPAADDESGLGVEHRTGADMALHGCEVAHRLSVEAGGEGGGHAGLALLDLLGVDP